MTKSEKKPCPTCGKQVTWTGQGVPRKHQCEPAQQAPKPEQQGKVTVDKVIAAFVKTRDEIAAAKKKFDSEMLDLTLLQEKRMGYLLKQLEASNAVSMKTEFGTCFVDYKDSATVADRSVFLEWVHENWEERNEFIENRVSKTSVKEYIESYEKLPPGVNYVRTKGVKVRKA